MEPHAPGGFCRVLPNALRMFTVDLTFIIDLFVTPTQDPKVFKLADTQLPRHHELCRRHLAVSMAGQRAHAHACSADHKCICATCRFYFDFILRLRWCTVLHVVCFRVLSFLGVVMFVVLL